MRTPSLLLALTLLGVMFAGCMNDDTDGAQDDGPITEGSTFDDPAMDNFQAFNMPAVHQGHGLYEPTIDVSNTGVIYVSAHSTGIGKIGAPAYYSKDDGITWSNLPARPEDEPDEGERQDGTPPGSDEIFIVAGKDGTAWGVDINLRNYLITGWCNEAAEMCYHNPTAYDHEKTTSQAQECAPVPLKDRPWAAWAEGKLFIVNNAGGGPAQIAIMDVPPADPVGAGPEGIEWNLCGSSGGFIPGIPDMRDDHFFAVPQRQGNGQDTHYTVAVGNGADIMTTEEYRIIDAANTAAYESDSTPSEISPYGQVVFDDDDTLWFAVMNNSRGEGTFDCNDDDEATNCPVVSEGGFVVAASTDDAQTWTGTRFTFPAGVSNVYIDGNEYGPGALVNWGVIDGAHTDWYMGHLFLNETGTPTLSNVMLAFDDGPEASRHVQGAAIGPDGRAYMVMSYVSGNDDQAMAAAAGTTPMWVVVQQDGPTLPVA